MKALMASLRTWAKDLKRQTMVLWFCYRHPQTSWLPKWLAIFVVAYALSPIDLIPDFIPILGYLDDLIILPLGIWLVIRLMPPTVLAECQEKALAWERTHAKRPVSMAAAFIVVLIWLMALTGTFFAFVDR
jgi:uncharacterized membrane protein YkvA (DUF1232 family)